MQSFFHRRGRRGNQIMEMSLMLVPLFGLLFGIIDFAFAVFVRSTMEHAVREGARYAVTWSVKPGKCQEASIKQVVTEASLGMLSGTNADKIKVRFYNPEADSITGAFTEISAGGNSPGNIVEVSVENYLHQWMVPLYWGKDPLKIQVRSADRLEGLAAGISAPCR